MSNKRITLIVVVALIMIHIDYRMFFATYNPKSISTSTGYLSKKPEFHRGGVRQSSSWWFYMNDRTFELSSLNSVGISKKEILKLNTNEEITFYTYDYSSFGSLIDFLNGRSTIVGIETKDFKKFSHKKIWNEIRRQDVSIFWGLNFFLTLLLIAVFSKKQKKEIDTPNTK